MDLAYASSVNKQKVRAFLEGL